MKICYKLLYVIQGVKKIYILPDIKVFGCIYVPVCTVASDWPHTFLPMHAKYFAYMHNIWWTLSLAIREQIATDWLTFSLTNQLSSYRADYKLGCQQGWL